MKKKKLKKISKFIVSEIRNVEKMTQPVRESINYCDYDESVSDKMKSLIVNLIKYKENVNINVNETQFNISASDIKNIKLPRIKNSYSEDDFLEISVNKEGFTISKGYNSRSNYKDESIFNDLNEIVSKRLIEINKENFTEIWEDILKESGIMRDNNLNQLFNE
jgi:hypothetical protein